MLAWHFSFCDMVASSKVVKPATRRKDVNLPKNGSLSSCSSAPVKHAPPVKRAPHGSLSSCSSAPLKGAPHGVFSSCSSAPVKQAPLVGAITPMNLGRPVLLGSDFTGMDAPGLTLRELHVACRSLFASDSGASCRQLLKVLEPTADIYTDVRHRPCQYDVDLYVSGWPCTPFSTAGDPLMVLGSYHALEFIGRCKPRAVLLENVPAMTTRHKDVYETCTAFLTAAGYTWLDGIIDTQYHGAPQRRRRWYLQAVRTDCLTFPLQFPLPDPQPSTLDGVITPLPRHLWRPHPCPRKQPRGYKCVMRYLDQHRHTCGNVFTTPIVVDIGSSEGWETSSVNVAMTLTRTRCSQFGHWVSSKGGLMDIHDYEACHGIPRGLVPMESAGISHREYASMLGNTMSMAVLKKLLPLLLASAGIINLHEFTKLIRRAHS